MESNRLLQTIGEGSFSTIYRVKNGEHEIAQKHMRYASKNNEMDSCMELDMCFRYSHPHKLNIYGFEWKSTGGYILDMRLMTTDLHGVRTQMSGIQSWQITELQRKQCLFQIMSAVQYMHSQQLVHADLKPENILVNLYDNGEAEFMLTDFGATLPNHALSSSRMTSSYTPLENVGRNSKYTTKTDIWSLGVIALEMFTTEYLWDDINELGNYLHTTKLSTKKESSKTMVQVKHDHERAIQALNIVSLTNEQVRPLFKLMLRLNASERITIDHALNHPFFSEFVSTLPDIKSKIVHQKEMPIFKSTGVRSNNYTRLLSLLAKYKVSAYAVIVALELYCRLPDKLAIEHSTPIVCLAIAHKYCGARFSFDAYEKGSSKYYREKESEILSKVIMVVYPTRFRHCNKISDIRLLLDYIEGKSNVLPSSNIGDGEFLMQTNTSQFYSMLTP
jgi:serine/threonine protein kinase